LDSPVTTVLFACVHNAGRSQMAAAFFNARADPRRARAISAGTEPAESVHPEVLATMRELGMELGGATPTFLSAGLARSADLLVTMGCGDACPVAPGVRRLDWNLADPKGRPAAEVRAIRDEIRARVLELLRANGWLLETG
jgi:arsenate reductase